MRLSSSTESNFAAEDLENNFSAEDLVRGSLPKPAGTPLRLPLVFSDYSDQHLILTFLGSSSVFEGSSH
jgi:hypothetical protein